VRIFQTITSTDKSCALTDCTALQLCLDEKIGREQADPPAKPLILQYDDKITRELVKSLKDQLKVKEEVSMACFYYSYFPLHSI
jgi:hypothetical protein